MEESPEEAIKREEMLRMYHACKESLRIIGYLILLIDYLNKVQKYKKKSPFKLIYEGYIRVLDNFY